MSFIKRVGDSASELGETITNVFASVAKDPKMQQELFEQVLTYATLPTDEPSISQGGDPSQVARNIGRLAAFEDIEQNKALAAQEAAKQRAKAAEQRAKERAEIAKENRDWEREVYKLVFETEKEGRLKRKETQTNAFNNWQNLIKESKAHYNTFAVQDDSGRFRPRSGYIQLLKDAKLFNLHSEDREEVNKGLVLFDKFVKNYRQEWQRQLDESKKGGSFDANREYIPGSHSIARGVQTGLLNLSEGTVPKGTYPSRDNQDGKTIINSVAERDSTKILTTLRTLFTRLVNQSYSNNKKEADAAKFIALKKFGFRNDEWKLLRESEKGMQNEILQNRFTHNSKHMDNYVNAVYSYYERNQELPLIALSLQQAITPVITQGGESSIAQDDITVTRQRIGYLKANPVAAKLAVKVGLITEQEYRHTVAQANETADSRNTFGLQPQTYNSETQASDKLGNVVTVKTLGEENGGAIADNLLRQKKNVNAALKVASTEIKNEYSKLQEEKKKLYEMSDSQYIDWVLRVGDVKAKFNQNIYGKTNLYLDAVLNKVAGLPTVQKTFKGNFIDTHVIRRSGLHRMKKTDKGRNKGEFTKAYDTVRKAQEQREDIRRAIKRISGLLYMDKTGLEIFGGGYRRRDLKQEGEAVVGGQAAEYRLTLANIARTFKEFITGKQNDKFVSDFFTESNLVADNKRYRDFIRMGASEFYQEYGYYNNDMHGYNRDNLRKLNNNLKRELDLHYEDYKKNRGRQGEEKARDVYLRRAALTWEKTALTYKLAGYVQGEQTGGRTISNQDFDNIYKSLWGGPFFTQDSVENAVRLLNFTNNQALDSTKAELILLETTGKSFQTDTLYSEISDRIYTHNWNNFLHKFPKVKNMLESNDKRYSARDAVGKTREVQTHFNYITQNVKINQSQEGINASNVQEGIRIFKNLNTALSKSQKENSYVPSDLALQDFFRIFDAATNKKESLDFSKYTRTLLTNYLALREASLQGTSDQQIQADVILNNTPPHIKALSSLLEQSGVLHMHLKNMGEKAVIPSKGSLQALLKSKFPKKGRNIAYLFENENFRRMLAQRYNLSLNSETQ